MESSNSQNHSVSDNIAEQSASQNQQAQTQQPVIEHACVKGLTELQLVDGLWKLCNEMEPMQRRANELRSELKTRNQFHKFFFDCPEEQMNANFKQSFDEYLAEVRQILKHFGKSERADGVVDIHIAS